MKELYKKVSVTQIIMMLCSLTQSQTSWSVKSNGSQEALITTNKARGGDGIPVELFQIQKDDAVKVLHSLWQRIWKTQPWPQDRKRQFSFQSQRREMPKNVQKSVKSLSRVQLFATPWTVAYQVPPSMGFSRQEYWSGWPFPSPGDLPYTGIKPGSPTLQADAFTV